MNSLTAQLQRLFGRPGQDLPDPWPEGGGLVELTGPDDRVWTLVLEVAPGAGWPPVAEVWQGVQSELELPAPVVSLAGGAGFRVWFALADPLPRALARRFLEALRRRYLPDVAESRVKLLPESVGPCRVPLAPAREGQLERWTAFIDPTMGSMFGDGAWLEMAPNPDKQADLLAGFRTLQPAEFARAMQLLEPGGAMVSALAGPVATVMMSVPAVSQSEGSTHFTLGVGGGFADPKSFLLAVMNDPSASAEYRIDAAKALLPYFTA
ncbi:hypothetical protein [Zoogloea sp.]|uniref:hypothetical protein n=1 Tax=Zoogloea sp. TaxID=49181 RepID=UPI002621C87D|nr:hypothetical protein [Zoogloea sp.]MDD3353072.1 hypothetical protein [Zoogloea sp.]